MPRNPYEPSREESSESKLNRWLESKAVRLVVGLTVVAGLAAFLITYAYFAVAWAFSTGP